MSLRSGATGNSLCSCTSTASHLIRRQLSTSWSRSALQSLACRQQRSLGPCSTGSAGPSRAWKQPRRQLCRPPAATRGRPRKVVEEQQQFEDGDQLTNVDEDFDGEQVVDEEDDDDLENWTEKVVDWWEFSNNELPTAGLSVTDNADVPWTSTFDKTFSHVAPNLAKLRQRKDFVGLLPIPDRKVFEQTAEPPEWEKPFTNPEWDEWEFRAYVEKQQRKAQARVEWNERRAEVGMYDNLVVDDRTDVRLQKPWDEQEKEWTYEEIFKLITLDGTAANPADVVMKVGDPMGRADLQELGGEYIESTEEFLRRTGHMLEHPPTQEDLADLGVTQLAQDFEGFEQSVGSGADSDGEGLEGDATSPTGAGARSPLGDGMLSRPVVASDDDGGGGGVMEEGWE